jgi:DNA-binding response OmpR family regulator
MLPGVLSGFTIVVVEDHGVVLPLLAQFLSQQCARVIACARASEALEAVMRERPALILSDINLPDEDGFQLLKSIRRLGPEIGGNTPAIAMSALGSTITIQRALAAGFCSYLGKPFTPKQLLQAIQAVLRPQS